MELFQRHQQPVIAGSILADYEIQSVQRVATATADKTQLRTLVLFAVHKQLTNKPLAIKITPIYDEARRNDFVREQQLHYLLTQLDAPDVRAAARVTGPAAKELFKADRANPIEHEEPTKKSALVSTEHNVVPLFDFVIQQFSLDSIPLIAGRNLLDAITWTTAQESSILVQGRLDGVLAERLPENLRDTLLGKTNNLRTLMRYSHNAIMQICCTLHLLLPIAFTHGDTHPANIGYTNQAAAPRHYELAPGKIFRVPRDMPHIMLLDFDNSRAEMVDATGSRFVMVPDQASLDKRFGGRVKMTPEMTFSPMVDVFRLVHGILTVFAQRLQSAEVSWDVGLEQTQDFDDFAKTCAAGISNIPLKFAQLPGYQNLSRFVESLSSRNRERIKAAAQTLLNDRDQQRELWFQLYAMTPKKKSETAQFLMPWDVLATYTAYGDPEAESINMTLSAVYGKGKVYRPSSVKDASDATMRIHPLQAAGLLSVT